jgi:hypothetical protein
MILVMIIVIKKITTITIIVKAIVTITKIIITTLVKTIMIMEKTIVMTLVKTIVTITMIMIILTLLSATITKILISIYKILVMNTKIMEIIAIKSQNNIQNNKQISSFKMINLNYHPTKLYRLWVVRYKSHSGLTTIKYQASLAMKW